MIITHVTPFRQILKAYSTLISIPGAISNLQDALSAQQGKIQESFEKVNQKLGDLESMNSVTAPQLIDIYDRMGFKLVLDSSSIVDKTMIETGTWEMEQLSFFGSLIDRLRGRENPVFLDIGSYWGLYSLIAHRSGVFQEIISFEADPFNRGQLHSNLWLNGISNNVKVIDKAVSSCPGTLKFWDSRTHPNGNRAGVGVLPEVTPWPSFQVEATTIDIETNFSGAHILMKIDVEGHEDKALIGMERTVRDNKVVMQIEVFEQQYETVFAIASRLGLRVILEIRPDFYLTNIPHDELGM
ncbi:FkbM family methyltransferase [Burkholderia sp. AU45274]|uniref:FkbM family methyltransferase n=1 Tax=Burkholderia sp. AU45274 TaxID=3059205 RepID=UPI002655B3E5|nr:FkbM family methyltransferase [Burkholderia sp. AU45274]MDN7490608.1 FkbM family methyltransferase [Burkholderia sp. AU45274]